MFDEYIHTIEGKQAYQLVITTHYGNQKTYNLPVERFDIKAFLLGYPSSSKIAIIPLDKGLGFENLQKSDIAYLFFVKAKRNVEAQMGE